MAFFGNEPGSANQFNFSLDEVFRSGANEFPGAPSELGMVAPVSPPPNNLFNPFGNPSLDQLPGVPPAVLPEATNPVQGFPQPGQPDAGAVNIFNPNPLQLAGAELNANPILSIGKFGDRVTSLGDLIDRFTGPDRSPLGGSVRPGGTGSIATGASGENEFLGDEFSSGEATEPEFDPNSLLPEGVPGAVPGDGTAPGTTPGAGGVGGAPAGSLADEVSKILGEAGQIREPFVQQFSDLLSGRFDPATSPTFVAQREAIEDQFRSAEDQIRATLPAGGPLNSALAQLSASKGRAISDTLSNILGEERDKAFQFATGQTGLGVAGLEGAERLALSGELGRGALDLQKQQLENAIRQADEARKEEEITGIFDFIFHDVLGL